MISLFVSILLLFASLKKINIMSNLLGIFSTKYCDQMLGIFSTFRSLSWV